MQIDDQLGIATPRGGPGQTRAGAERWTPERKSDSLRPAYRLLESEPLQDAPARTMKKYSLRIAAAAALIALSGTTAQPQERDLVASWHQVERVVEASGVGPGLRRLPRGD